MRNYRSPMPIRPYVLFVATAMMVCVFVRAASAVPSFDEQRKAVAISPATQTEETIVSLLLAGIAEQKPTEAVAVAQQWLRQNVAANPLLLYHAGHAAELSGDWRTAVALFQQYLKRADLKSPTAQIATLAVYTLLLDQLNDVEGAYAYMSTEGNRLHSCGRAKQFDTWYLDMAIRRQDRNAVAKRLLACTKDPSVSNDLLITRYQSYFRWLLDTISGWNFERGQFSPEFVANVKALAKGITFDEELRLRLDWTISVKQYNMNLVHGKEAKLPLQEATALLNKYPQFAELVQTGWAERRGRYYKDDPKKYWPIDVEHKLKPVKAAAAKLEGLELADFYQSWGGRYYDSGPQVFTVEEAREYALANPKVVNSKSGPDMGFDWRNMTFEEAQKLAPVLEQNPHSEASMVRAIAAAGEEKDLDKAMAALLGPEIWRLSTGELSGSAADQLWHWCGRPGDSAKRDQEIARSKKVATTLASPDVKASDPVAKRLDMLKKLWGDFRSRQPKMPYVRSRLIKVLTVTHEALP